MTRIPQCAATRRARRHVASRRLQVSLKSVAAIILAVMLIVPPHALASRRAGGESLLSTAPRAFVSLLNMMAAVVSAGRRGSAAQPGAGGVGAAAGAPQLPVTITVTQLTIPSLPLDPTPPPLDPPDQNMQVYGPLVLQSMEPINLTAVPLDANGNTVSGAQP
jgi:hypothetical protein